jgi:hypothetical protein
MRGIKVEIIRYVDDYQPGIVECSFVDAWGNQYLFVEKAPVVSSENLDAGSSYPRAGVIACQVIERRNIDGREVVEIETELPWHIESTAGNSSFDVLPDQLIEFD